LPKVSIGLPVYNGQNYLKKAIESILTQSYQDFELIISDNASTDLTSEICQSFDDPRIQYYRNEKNLGAAWNTNRVFELSSGEYFKLAAHDDILETDFLESCIKVLEQDISAVLAYTCVKVIDCNGDFVRDYPLGPWHYLPIIKAQLKSPNAAHRFFEIIIKPHMCHPIFGVIRSDCLPKNCFMGDYVHADRVTLARLALRGKMVQIPQHLFLWRY